MRPLDWVVMAAYGAAILGVGWHFARRQHDAADYFLGHRDLPWWAVMMSIVATETSAITVISIPGIAARGDLTFLQLPAGYLVGRLGIAAWLLPGYFHGEQETAYARLETRFGSPTRRVASAVFLVVRSLADSVRVYATAIPLTVVTGWSIPASVIVLSLITVAYTWAGGLRAVVWADVVQLGVYLSGGLAVLLTASHLAGGAAGAFSAAAGAGKLHVINWHFSFSTPYSLVGGVLGGALLSAASHGTDHLIVQRLLASRNLKDAQRAVVGSGVIVIAQFALFLLAGTMLWAAQAADPAVPSDLLFPRFVVNHLPEGLAGLVIAGILAATMSTHSSALNSLASATTHDFYAPLSGRRDPAHLLGVGRWVTLGWAAILGVGALGFRSTGQPVVELALSIASITYGGLLGTYILAGTAARVRQRDVIAAIAVATAVMVIVVVGKPGPFSSLAWPWYVPLGTAVTLLVGYVSSLVPRAA